MKSVYISHPFGGKAINLTLASRWVAWAAKQPGIAPMAPWIILGAYFSEEEGRTRGLEIDCCHVELCQELWICGPKVCGTENINTYFNDVQESQDSLTRSLRKYDNLSHGMYTEVYHALANKVVVHDMRQFIEQVL